MLGTGTDLQIFHTGSAGEIGNFTGNLNIKTNSFRLFNGGANQLYIKADQNDSVVLYHSNNEKFRTTNTGSVVTGILTATSFEGDGSNLTGITGTTINNNADNRVITGSGTANTLNAESGLTFDGTNLDIDSDSGHLRIGADQDLDLYHNGSNGYLKNSTGQQLYRSETHTFENAAGSTEYLRINANGMIEMRSDMSSSGQENKNIFRFTDTDAGTGGNQSMGRLQWFSSDTSGNGACVKAEIEALASDTTPDGYMVFKTHNTGTTPTERLRITSNGDLIIGSGGSWSYPKALNVQGQSGSIISLYNADTTSYAADTNTSIEFKLLTGNTGNQTGACEIRAFKENGTNGNNARALSFYTGSNGGSNAERLRISSAGYVTKPAHPSFCARYSNGEANSYSSGNVIKLTLVAGNYLTWDTTSSYSTSTGKFTAPVDGVYYFEGQLMTTGHSNGDNIQDLIQLRSSNGLISHPRQRKSYFTTTNDANGYFTNSCAGQTKLSAGDTVWIQANRSFGVLNTNYSYFTGWLIG